MSTIRVTFVQKWREKEKTTFSYRIVGNFPYGFTQILSLGTHWMRNLIPHPTHTQNAYFWGTHDTQKMKISIKQRFLILKNVFYWNFHFWVPWVHKKYAMGILKNIFYWNFYFWVPWIPHTYAMWVWVGCRIKFHIQIIPKLKICVNQ